MTSAIFGIAVGLANLVLGVTGPDSPVDALNLFVAGWCIGLSINDVAGAYLRRRTNS